VGQSLFRSLFLFPVSFLGRHHSRLAAFGTIHLAGIVGQHRKCVVITGATARNLILVDPGAAEGIAMLTPIQRQKWKLRFSMAHADAAFLVLAKFAFEAYKTSHGHLSLSVAYFFFGKTIRATSL